MKDLRDPDVIPVFAYSSEENNLPFYIYAISEKNISIHYTNVNANSVIEYHLDGQKITVANPNLKVTMQGLWALQYNSQGKKVGLKLLFSNAGDLPAKIPENIRSRADLANGLSYFEFAYRGAVRMEEALAGEAEQIAAPSFMSPKDTFLTFMLGIKKRDGKLIEECFIDIKKIRYLNLMPWQKAVDILVESFEGARLFYFSEKDDEGNVSFWYLTKDPDEDKFDETKGRMVKDNGGRWKILLLNVSN